jgi:hypothetical protein
LESKRKKLASEKKLKTQCDGKERACYEGSDGIQSPTKGTRTLNPRYGKKN